MKLTFLGAAHEVTGSCTLLSVNGRQILIDCGLEQGADTFENTPLPLSPAEIDCVLLTHAHIDHSGRLPALTAGGFRGPIYATGATVQLCGITRYLRVRDSAHIQESEANGATAGPSAPAMMDMNRFTPCRTWKTPAEV